MEINDVTLQQETLDLLDLVAKRRDWTSLPVDARVRQLARDALGPYWIIDLSLGDPQMDSTDKPKSDISDAELMRRGLEKLPSDPALKELSDDELLNFVGEERRRIDALHEERTKGSEKASTVKGGRV